MLADLENLALKYEIRREVIFRELEVRREKRRQQRESPGRQKLNGRVRPLGKDLADAPSSPLTHLAYGRRHDNGTIAYGRGSGTISLTGIVEPDADAGGYLSGRYRPPAHGRRWKEPRLGHVVSPAGGNLNGR
jgi:hypothetical protein